MNKIVLFIFLTISSTIESAKTNAQTIIPDKNVLSTPIEKQLIDTSVYKRWTCVEGARITNNGAFASYIIRNDSMRNDFTAVLTSVNGNWTMRLPNISDVEFTGDSRMAVAMNRDTLFTIRLGVGYVDKISNVDFFYTAANGKGEWICFKYNSSDNLVVYNVSSGEKKVYPSVKSSYFSGDGKKIIIRREDGTNNIQSIDFLELGSGKLFNAWKGKGLLNMKLNSAATQAVLLLLDKDGRGKSIWAYERGKPGLDLLVNNKILGVDSSWVLTDNVEISVSGKYISFSIERMKSEPVNLVTQSSTVNIWSYLDVKLQSLQSKTGEQPLTFPFVIDRDNHRITQLCKERESVMSTSRDNDTYVVERVDDDADGFELSWNSSAQRTYYVKSIRNNTNVLLNIKEFHIVDISPEGKYAIYYDKGKSNYFTYEIASGIYRNITSGINVAWTSMYGEDFSPYQRGICGWGNNDEWVLIYDKFDIWKIDPRGKKNPVNITNGYGLRNGVVLDLALPEAYGRIFSEFDTLILNGLNVQNKQNGFFQKRINSDEAPELLIMGNYIYQLINNPYLIGQGAYPLKAKNAAIFIVTRMSANESPNYFSTIDFRHFTQLSYVSPEKGYNWYRTELHTWRKKDGKMGQGILYKPENFDSSRRYPVIFHYYEKKSFSLNEYLSPKNIVNGCNIDIPTFVSNDYLVFTPDIDYVVGDPMQGTFDAVISAANYVSELPFVRSDRMGIGGCSFGGLQTNYLITHSGLFAAAYSASSICDLVSAYDDVPGRGRSMQAYFEIGQGRMAVPLWENPDGYIKNSPIFHVDKVTTPLLLMHTTNDGIASFSQALEMYTALRRLGKKVWLLEYTDGNHGIDGKSADDFAIRLSQFFSHYLMNTSAPKWMTRGIPARLKGIDKGYDLDPNIVTPGNGLLKVDVEKK